MEMDFAKPKTRGDLARRVSEWAMVNRSFRRQLIAGGSYRENKYGIGRGSYDAAVGGIRNIHEVNLAFIVVRWLESRGANVMCEVPYPKRGKFTQLSGCDIVARRGPLETWIEVKRLRQTGSEDFIPELLFDAFKLKVGLASKKGVLRQVIGFHTDYGSTGDLEEKLRQRRKSIKIRRAFGASTSVDAKGYFDPTSLFDLSVCMMSSNYGEGDLHDFLVVVTV